MDRPLLTGALASLGRRKPALVCLAVVAVYFLVALILLVADLAGSRIGSARWSEQVGPSYSPPSGSYLFGTDMLGRSVLRKTLYGARVSVTVALAASVISILIGVPLGAAAGYLGGALDRIIVWLYSTLGSIPYIILIIAFAVVLRDKTVLGYKLAGLPAVCLAMGITSWVGISRLVRAEIIKLKHAEYVLAAVSYGCGAWRIIFGHLLPNISHLVIAQVSVRFVSFVHSEVILGFLGLGHATRPSWGAMINDARLELARGVWWQMAAAALAVFVLCLALNIFADALSEALDPKLRSHR